MSGNELGCALSTSMLTVISHMTHVGNLPSILKSGGLLSTNELDRRGIKTTSIAYSGIQARRAFTMVPCGQRGVVHDYVPFFFSPLSPMLYAIKMKKVPSCPDGQASIVHLVSTAEAIRAAGCSFVFTDGHAIMDMTQFYDDLSQLGQVNWNVMKSRYWFDTPTYPDRARCRAAEFLVHEFVEWQLITEVVAIDASLAARATACLGTAGVKPPVRVDRSWYH